MAKKKKAAKKVAKNKTKLRLLPDVPIGEGISKTTDGLRFSQYASILARAALDTPEPFTIGIYGGWGSGKTSMMRLMSQNIEKESDAIPVWFNAWRYEKEEHLIIPLLATIITELNQRESKLKGDVKKAAKSLKDAFRAVLYGFSVKGKLGIPGLTEAELSISPKEMIDRYEKLSEMATERILDQSLYFRSFGKLDEIAKSIEGLRLVVFIDDLDRCFPDKAVALLEGVKLVLNQPNIAFVLGIAPDIIRAYLTAKYKRDYDISEELYEDYLDKLVQLPFPIPEIKQDVPDYVRRLLRKEDVFGAISKNVFDEQYEPLVSICGPACKDNPRAIIRFLNRLLLLKQVHEQKKTPKGKRVQISLVHFGITNALQMKWPRVYKACELNKNIPHIEQPEKTDTLCNMISLIFKNVKDKDIISVLEQIAGQENNPESQIFQAIANDESLRALLNSKPGKEWLTEPKLRKEALSTSKQVKTTDDKEWSEQWPVVKGYVIRPKADLYMAELGGADLSEVDLRGANLRGADLKEAILTGVDLRYANLRGANLRGADLKEADLRMANLNEVRYNSLTSWPAGFDPKKRGAINDDESQ